MMKRMYTYALGAWFLMGVMANINGIFRNSVITPRLGEHAGHVISTALFICIIVAITYAYVTRMGPVWSRGQLFGIGVAWLLMTIAFEFVFGHYVIGHSWDRLLADYDILAGRVWSLVLVATLAAPLLTGTMAGMVRRGEHDEPQQSPVD